VKERVGIVSIALLVAAIAAASKGADAVEVAALLGLFVCRVAYLVLRVREHRREKAAKL
jgi:hypothetical protein